MRKLIVCLSVSMLLFGCVNQQQTRRPTATDDPSNRCFGVFVGDPRLEPLIPKIGSLSQPDDVTLEMMANKEKPNETEKAALSIWAAARKSCVDLGRSFRAQYAPSGYSNSYETMQAGILSAIAALYAGDITYGQFIAERSRLTMTGQDAMVSSSERDQSVRNQQARDEQERRNAITQSILQRQRDSQPVTTNCYKVGNSISCTTR